MSAPIDQQIREYTEFFEAQLTDVTVEEAGTDRITLDSTGTMLRRRSGSGRSWTIAVAAGATIGVLIGGAVVLMWMGGFERTPATESPAPPPTTTATDTPTTTLETGVSTTQVITAATTVNQITIDVTSSVVPGLGTLIWDRVVGDETSLPEGIEADPSGGFVSYEGTKVWRSSDAVTWTFEEAALEFADLQEISIRGDWALGWNGDQSELYERVGESWEPVNLGNANVPNTPGIDWRQRLRIPIDSSGIAVIDGSSYGMVAWGEVYGTFEVDCGQAEPCEQQPYAMWDAPSETFRVDDPNNGATIAVLSMTADQDMISFVDVDSDETVHTIVASIDYPASQIADELVRHGGLVYPGGWISEQGGGFVWVAFPWRANAEVLAVPDGGFAAYEFVYDWQANPSTPLVSATMWTSQNGADWTNAGEPRS